MRSRNVGVGVGVGVAEVVADGSKVGVAAGEAEPVTTGDAVHESRSATAASRRRIRTVWMRGP